MNKKYVFGILGLMLFATISFSGCIDMNYMEIKQSNIVMTIHRSDETLSLMITGNHIDLTINQSVWLKSVNIQGNYVILRLSQVHRTQNYSMDDTGLNTLIEYYD